MFAKLKPGGGPVKPPQTRAEAADVLGGIGALDVELAALQGKVDAEVRAVQQRYEANLQALRQRREEHVAVLTEWAEKHRQFLLQGDERTFALPTGECTWRATPPKAVYGSGRADKLKLIAALKSAGLGDYVRVSEEPDKDKLRLETNPARLAELNQIEGLSIEQGEVFVIKPNA